MADDSDLSKTEAPTPRKLEQAREEGQVAFSPDLNSAVALLVAAMAAIWLLPLMGEQMKRLLIDRIVHLDGGDWNEKTTVVATRWVFQNLWAIAGGISLSFLGINILLAQVQTGFILTTKPLEPKWDRLNPVQGMKRLFSIDSLVRGLQVIIKVTTFGTLSSVIFWLWLGTLQTSTQGSLEESVGLGWRMIVQIMLVLSGAAFVWGVGDYGFRWFRLQQKLRMSMQEIKDEAKEEQGDPLLKGHIRKMQREAAQRKTLTDVPKASVVITNPTHYAIALQYEPGRMKAPKILAKGSDAFARRIAKVAREHGIPVLERKSVARALYAIGKVGEDVPVEFYRVVAEILAYVYRLKNNR